MVRRFLAGYRHPNHINGESWDEEDVTRLIRVMRCHPHKPDPRTRRCRLCGSRPWQLTRWPGDETGRPPRTGEARSAPPGTSRLYLAAMSRVSLRYDRSSETRRSALSDPARRRAAQKLEFTRRPAYLRRLREKVQGPASGQVPLA